jgi:hypothetical protein
LFWRRRKVSLAPSWPRPAGQLLSDDERAICVTPGDHAARIANALKGMR